MAVLTRVSSPTLIGRGEEVRELRRVLEADRPDLRELDLPADELSQGRHGPDVETQTLPTLERPTDRFARCGRHRDQEPFRTCPVGGGLQLVEAPEHARVERDRDRHVAALAPARFARLDALDGRRGGGVAVRITELGERVGALRGVVELGVHRPVVLEPPGAREVARGPLLDRGGAGTDHHADARREHGQRP